VPTLHVSRYILSQKRLRVKFANRIIREDIGAEDEDSPRIDPDRRGKVIGE